MASTEDLKKKILSWLENQGYPLEMMAARIFQKVGFKVIQSTYYSDPEDGTSREIDVVAFIGYGFGNIGFDLTLVLECKSGADKPWLLLTLPGSILADETKIHGRPSSSFGQEFLSYASREPSIGDLSLFQSDERKGYALIRAFSQGQDTAYTALMDLSKAALAEASLATKEDLPAQICRVVIPILLVDAPLFEAYLDSGSEFVLNEINRGTLYWRKGIAGTDLTVIDIVSIQNLEDYVKMVWHDAHELLELFQQRFIKRR
jgi:hypothetical protein